MRGRGAGVIGVVAVHQHIDVGLDVGEHAAHDIALALAQSRVRTMAPASRARAMVWSLELLS